MPSNEGIMQRPISVAERVAILEQRQPSASNQQCNYASAASEDCAAPVLASSKDENEFRSLNIGRQGDVLRVQPIHASAAHAGDTDQTAARLYAATAKLQPEHAGRITESLLGMPAFELQLRLESDSQLRRKIQDVIGFLRDQDQRRKQTHEASPNVDNDAFQSWLRQHEMQKQAAKQARRAAYQCQVVNTGKNYADVLKEWQATQCAVNQSRATMAPSNETARRQTAQSRMQQLKQEHACTRLEPAPLPTSDIAPTQDEYNVAVKDLIARMPTVQDHAESNEAVRCRDDPMTAPYQLGDSVMIKLEGAHFDGSHGRIIGTQWHDVKREYQVLTEDNVTRNHPTCRLTKLFINECTVLVPAEQLDKLEAEKSERQLQFLLIDRHVWQAFQRFDQDVHDNPSTPRSSFIAEESLTPEKLKQLWKQHMLDNASGDSKIS